MVTTTRVRFLRLKYKISLVKLAAKAGISNQQLSRLELNQINATQYWEGKVTEAFLELIADEKTFLANLEKDFFLYKGRLLEPMEVEHDEL